ncbi:hypothetical protein PVAP13_1NG400900 [Panicum virgatum]|uniref:Secreted protein n=1 Tax=Panicum virgatum TaxID=38727 RepID=A0A8T0X740_PANVG|nr:hypothetical protein PVAP13_1NG400900 [Panicum virgatum]
MRDKAPSMGAWIMMLVAAVQISTSCSSLHHWPVARKKISARNLGCQGTSTNKAYVRTTKGAEPHSSMPRYNSTRAVCHCSQ